MSNSIALSELPLGQKALLDVDGEPVVVANTEEGIFAISDTCSHAEVSLFEGELNGCLLECWMHGSAFDMRTGAPLTPPAFMPVSTYQVSIEGEGQAAVIRVHAKDSE